VKKSQKMVFWYPQKVDFSRSEAELKLWIIIEKSAERKLTAYTIVWTGREDEKKNQKKYDLGRFKSKLRLRWYPESILNTDCPLELFCFLRWWVALSFRFLHLPVFLFLWWYLSIFSSRWPFLISRSEPTLVTCITNWTFFSSSPYCLGTHELTTIFVQVCKTSESSRALTRQVWHVLPSPPVWNLFDWRLALLHPL
jgi:hypothetical protein